MTALPSEELARAAELVAKSSMPARAELTLLLRSAALSIRSREDLWEMAKSTPDQIAYKAQSLCPHEFALAKALIKALA